MSVDISKFQWPGVHEKIRDEVRLLSQQGVDVEFVNPSLEGHYLLDDENQLRVNAAIEDWSKRDGFLEQMFAELSPGARAWADLSKRAIALHAFYNTGSVDAPADGIDHECLDWPLFDGRSARELTVAESDSPERAARIMAKYDTFFAGHSLRVGKDHHGLTAHDYIAGSVDRIADVTRAVGANNIMIEHASKNEARYSDRGVVIASFGSGLAESDIWAAKELMAKGVTVDAVHGFDSDPIALAAALSRAKAHGLEGVTQYHRKNFIKKPVGNYIDAASVDYANLIGLIEYIPAVVAKYRMASNLLRQVAPVVRPGGLIIFGNMVADRAQQEWFEGIWPSLYQRNIEQVLCLIEEAGFSRDQVQVRITEGEGIYALYAIKIPESGEIPEPVSFMQAKLGKFVTRNMPEY